jgi:hypothetical protein
VLGVVNKECSGRYRPSTSTITYHRYLKAIHRLVYPHTDNEHTKDQQDESDHLPVVSPTENATYRSV